MSGRRDWLSISRRERALEHWEAHVFAADEAESIAEERARRSLEAATVDELVWLDSYDPSRESAVMRDWHPEADW